MFKPLFFGMLAAIGVATVAHDAVGLLGDFARWHSLQVRAAGYTLFFSVPVFVVVTLFGWGFIAWSRD